MKKIITLFAIAICVLNCKAQQQVYPLNTYYEDVPNYSYMKDLNNFLPQYVGTYKATYQGNEITLYITKEDKYLKDYGPGDRKFYKDVLHIKYIVKNLSTGAILEDNQNLTDPKRNRIISFATNDLDNNSVSLHYSGTTCRLGSGEIILKKINSTQISWSFDYEARLLIQGECPDYQNIKVYLPKTSGLIFTKQ
jgi:hypothetical protein